jgi:hypothetical protein
MSQTVDYSRSVLPLKFFTSEHYYSCFIILLPAIIIILSFIGATPKYKSGDPLLLGQYPAALSSELRMSQLHLIVKFTLAVPGAGPSVNQHYCPSYGQ